MRENHWQNFCIEFPKTCFLDLIVMCMKKYFIFIYCFLRASLVFSQENQKNMDILTHSSSFKDYVGKEVVLEGLMQMKKFNNKAGRGMDFYEFYLEMQDGTSILLRNNTGKALSKEPFTHKVHLRGKIFYGNIDDNDPKVQSRVGYRFDFTEWKIIERR